MELIITEKENAARRIAAILSDETATADTSYETTVYRWEDTACVGLSGHVVGVDFPEEYHDWTHVEPAELVDAAVETTPTQEGIVDTVRALAAEADRVSIATDYDREGELIGKEAYDLVRAVDESVPIDRVRFSSITDGEVQAAFAEPETLDFELAAAGKARQIIDLLWGASLTRFLSLAAGQRGDDFISVGRVQTPTLKLIVDREREIEAFDPTPYWELTAKLGEEQHIEAAYFHREDGSETTRIWDREQAAAAATALTDTPTATVETVRRRDRTDTPPAPFDTTAFIRAAGSLGYGAQRAMSIAEDLYTAGYITYPRTDNTVYPEDLDPAALLETLSAHPEFGEDAATIADQAPISPTQGDEETTDHPPIYPTGELPAADDLSGPEWEVYELVVRHFLATCAEPAQWEQLRLTAVLPEASVPVQLKATGRRLVAPGYLAVYPYTDATESRLPAVAEGDTLSIVEVERNQKETQPPRRYGQSRLVELMADRGIGTKATRHHTIEKLYDRGYIEENPPRPTQLARAVVDAADEFAAALVDEQLTQDLEADMDAIARGEQTLTETTEASRALLRDIFAELTAAHEEVGAHLQESLKADRALGPCPECGSQLLVRESRGGNYFVGCDGYPDCEFTLPLPDTGRPVRIDTHCEDHDLAHVKMLAGSDTFVHGCPRCVAAAAGEGVHLGPCPQCDAGTLAVKQLANGSRLAGCTTYPECEYSVPLPRRGDLVTQAATCPHHDLQELAVEYEDGDPWTLGCPVCNYREYRAQETASGTDLEVLDGVGPALAERFVDAGVESIQDLGTADPETLAAAVPGVSADRIRDWQAIA